MSAFVGEGATGPSDDRPLNDQEYQLLQRLLSDPFSLPQQFKTWLVSYLEGSDLTLPISSILGLQTLLGITGAGGGSLGILPAGLILPWGSDLAPTGSLLCDGASYSSTDQKYKRLFDVIKYRYGGSGAAFNVPDLRGRVPVGLGPNVAHDTLGKNEGVGVSTRSTKHGHTYDYSFSFTWTPETMMGWHNVDVQAGADYNDVLANGAYPSGEVGNHGHGTNASASSTLSRVGVNGQTEGPAYLTINFVIIN